MMMAFRLRMAMRLTVSRRLGIQPILFCVQSILTHGSIVSWTEPVVTHKIAPFMTSQPLPANAAQASLGKLEVTGSIFDAGNSACRQFMALGSLFG